MGSLKRKPNQRTFVYTWYSGVSMSRVVTPVCDMGTVTCINQGAAFERVLICPLQRPTINAMFS